jgi:hypothetical protein
VYLTRARVVATPLGVLGPCCTTTRPSRTVRPVAMHVTVRRAVRDTAALFADAATLAAP